MSIIVTDTSTAIAATEINKGLSYRQETTQRSVSVEMQAYLATVSIVVRIKQTEDRVSRTMNITVSNCHPRFIPLPAFFYRATLCYSTVCAVVVCPVRPSVTSRHCTTTAV